MRAGSSFQRIHPFHSMRIKLLREGKEEAARHISGASSKLYPFMWNTKSGYYEYEAKDQNEIEDIFMSSDPFTCQFFAPIIGTDAAAPKPVAPTIPRADYEQHDLQMLRALCKDCGLSPRASDDETLLKRMLDAFFLGTGVRQARAAVEEVVDAEPSTQRRRDRRPAAA